MHGGKQGGMGTYYCCDTVLLAGVQARLRFVFFPGKHAGYTRRVRVNVQVERNCHLVPCNVED